MDMKRVLVTGVSVLSLALFGSSAFAGPSTVKKGSVLVFPKIDIHADQGGQEQTIVRIANDYPADVQMKCYWQNGQKFHIDFEFWVTHNQPFWFDALTGERTKRVPPFPTNPGAYVAGPVDQGESSNAGR